MRIFKTKWFTRYARRSRITDESLKEAIARAHRGLVDADLGGGVIKQRIGRAGEGRSGGYRTLIGYRVNARAIFLYGFAKNERDNITPDELMTLREIGETWLTADAVELNQALQDGALDEVDGEDGKD